MRPVVFFSQWLGVVLTDPVQYVPTDNELEMAGYAPTQEFYWEGVEVVNVYWFTEGMASEEFIDFLEVVSPPVDHLDDPDFAEKMFNFYWTDDDD